MTRMPFWCSRCPLRSMTSCSNQVAHAQADQLADPDPGLGQELDDERVTAAGLADHCLDLGVGQHLHLPPGELRLVALPGRLAVGVLPQPVEEGVRGLHVGGHGVRRERLALGPAILEEVVGEAVDRPLVELPWFGDAVRGAPGEEDSLEADPDVPSTERMLSPAARRSSMYS